MYIIGFVVVQAKYDQHQEKLLKIAQMMNGTRSVHVLIDGVSLSAEDSVKKTILSEPLNDIQSAPSTLIPTVKSHNGRESYYRFV